MFFKNSNAKRKKCKARSPLKLSERFLRTSRHPTSRPTRHVGAMVGDMPGDGYAARSTGCICRVGRYIDQCGLLHILQQKNLKSRLVSTLDFAESEIVQQRERLTF